MRPDGGPAFPTPARVDTDFLGTRFVSVEPHQGMPLRDWFAGMALQGLLACGPARRTTIDGKLCESSDDWATAAYDFADSMLNVRNR